LARKVGTSDVTLYKFQINKYNSPQQLLTNDGKEESQLDVTVTVY